MDDQELLSYCNEHLSYDPISGIITWKKKTSRCVTIGGEAGSINGNGYLEIGINKTRQRNHRIAFLMHHGYLPKIIDHKDNDRLNNKINNLRGCTQSENKMNSGAYSNNKSGYKGVSWYPKSNKWQASIGLNRKVKHLGYFKCKHEAARAYNLAARMYHGKFAYTNEISI